MKAFQRILAVMLALVLSLSVLGTVAFASTVEDVQTSAIFDSTKTTGSLTINKYEKTSDTAQPIDATGTTQDVPEGYTALGGVTFSVYQVLTQEQLEAYLANTLTEQVGDEEQVVTTLKVSRFYDDATGAITNFNNETVAGITKTTPTDTNADTNEIAGQVIFSDLALGVYLVIESGYPEKVTEPMEPTLVFIPMTDPTAEDNWLYDVTIYPKNSTSEGTVNLTKTDVNGSAVQGATFKLEEKTTASNEDGTTTATWNQVGAVLTTDEKGSIPTQTLTPGDYRIREISAPNGFIADQSPIYFTVTTSNTITCTDSRTSGENALLVITGSGAKNLNITVKNEKPDAEKEIVTGENTSADEASYSIGDTVSYKVTVDVPANIDDLKTFTLTDTPTNLKDDITTVKVNGALDANSDMFAVAAEGDNGFKITFDTSKMSSVAGTTITVTYDATLLAGAADDIVANNDASLTYSNKIKTQNDPQDPGDPSDPDNPDDPDEYTVVDGAVVYTYKLGVTKFKDSATAGNELENVEFKLYTSATGGDALYVVKNDDGTYRLAVEDDTNTTQTLKTDTNGEIVVKGLANGTYYLEETKTIEGYNLLKGRVAIALKIDTVTNWEKTETYVDGVKVDETYESATHTSDDGDVNTTDLFNTDIVNKKGFNLPQTGGLGTLMFIIIGGVLIAGGVCLITVPNKKRAV